MEGQTQPAGKPTVNFDIPTTVCPLHGEVFRAEWPRGWLQFCLEGFQRLMADEDFTGELVEMGADPARPFSDQVDVINRAFGQRPLCCRLKDVSEEALLETYLKSDHWATKACVVCFMVRQGAPFRSAEKNYRHVCLECVIRRMRATPAKLPPGIGGRYNRTP